MKKALLLLFCLSLTSSAYAENTWIRNDNATNVINLHNGAAGLASTNDKGVVWVEGSNKAATFTSEVAIAFGSVTASYATALSNTNKLTLCILSNLTNASLSFDNGTNPIISGLPAGTIYIADFGASGRWVASNIRVKYTIGAPSAGAVYVNCYY